MFTAVNEPIRQTKEPVVVVHQKTKRKSRSRTKSVVEKLEIQREQTLQDLRSRDKGVRAWRRDSDTAKLHAIEHAQFNELERIEANKRKNTVSEPNLTGHTKDHNKEDMDHFLSISAAAHFAAGSFMTGTSSTKNTPKIQTIELTSTNNPLLHVRETAETKSQPDIPPGRGLLRFKKAIKKVQMNNSLRRVFDVNARRATALEHHVIEPHLHPCIGPMKMILHFISLLMILMISQSLWTYDGLDAVEMLEDQILRDSLYDHYSSKFTDVDSHPSFQKYVPTLIHKLFALPLKPVNATEVARPILRYKKKEEYENACVPKYFNKTYPFTTNSKRNDESSSSYKVFRPLSNSGNSAGFVKGGLVYLSDGLLIRQLRGSVKKGNFQPSKEKLHCGSRYNPEKSYRTFSSGAWGLYMKYPSNQGYDMYFSAEDKYTDVQKKYEDSLKCGWIDSESRAVMFVFTLTYFSELDNLKQPPNTVIDAASSYAAYGAYIEISVILTFDMPSNGLVRASFEFAVIDKSDVTLKWFCIFGLVFLNLIMTSFHGLDLHYLGTKKYFQQWRHILQLVALLIFWAAMAAYLWADQRQKFDPFDPARVLADPLYGQYKCSSLSHVEENAEKTSTKAFFFLFAWYAIIEFWMLIHYLRVFPIIMIPLAALTSSAMEIAFFFLVFFIVVLGFAFGAHIAFGEVYEFRSILHSIVTLLLISVDELDSSDLFIGTQHGWYGQVFVYMFRMIAAVIFLNIFIVIVLVQYEIARSEKRMIVDEMHQFFLLWGIRIVRIFGFVASCFRIDQTSEDYVTWFRKTYHDWREQGNGENSYPPLRHDTEVIMGELHKIKHVVGTLSEQQEKISLIMDVLNSTEGKRMLQQKTTSVNKALNKWKPRSRYPAVQSRR